MEGGRWKGDETSVSDLRSHDPADVGSLDLEARADLGSDHDCDPSLALKEAQIRFMARRKGRIECGGHEGCRCDVELLKCDRR